VPYTHVEGDLFGLGLPAIGHGCNCAGAMGAGIATEFRRRWPEMYVAYRARCRAGAFRLGDVFPWDGGDVVVYNLATQPVPGPSATLRDQDRGRPRARRASARGLAQIGVPRIGAGLGGLAWADVEATLRAAGEASPVELVAVS
jgi:O-acetyl-ADP-ribose deacetylase (regulator of RNase III)